jgi:hypothetical protein
MARETKNMTLITATVNGMVKPPKIIHKRWHAIIFSVAEVVLTTCGSRVNKQNFKITMTIQCIFFNCCHRELHGKTYTPC